MSVRRVRLLALLFVGVAALGLLAVAPLLEKGFRDPYNRTFGPARVLDLVRDAGFGAVGVCRCAPDRSLRLADASGFETAVSVFNGANGVRRGGALIVHGNTALGRRLGMYPLLARRLADRGYVVVTPTKRSPSRRMSRTVAPRRKRNVECLLA